MRSRSSLAGRALLALLLTIGFYGLALAIVAGLLFIPYAEIRYANRLHLKLALLCLVGAGTILWAILPRRDHFKPPGPRLDPKANPDLFDTVQDIAQKTDQRMPADVYLIPDANAFVAERGGFMGIGSRRVMGVGLALLQAFTVAQFRAVLAHEFGHFYGGDTKLGPWIYKTRASIVRTILGLRGMGGSSWIQIPFVWYAKLFLRVTHAVSRRQEFVADELAAQVVGVEHLVEGLRTIHGITPAFQVFWQREFAPALGAGYRPSLAEGFSLFVSQSFIAEAMEKTIEKEMDSTETSPYDTHPSLFERIAALQNLPAGSGPGDDTPAISLLENVPELEQRLLSHLFGEDKIRSWKPLAWQDSGAAICVPAWEKVVRKYGVLLKDVTPASLPDFLLGREQLAHQFTKLAGKIVSQAEAKKSSLRIAEVALALTLFNEGWQIDATPGAEVTLGRDESVIRPFSEIEQLASGELAVETWRQRCEQAGIAHLNLG